MAEITQQYTKATAGLQTRYESAHAGLNCNSHVWDLSTQEMVKEKVSSGAPQVSDKWRQVISTSGSLRWCLLCQVTGCNQGNRWRNTWRFISDVEQSVSPRSRASICLKHGTGRRNRRNEDKPMFWYFFTFFFFSFC